MRALTSCALNATLTQALETQWHWEVDTVDSISTATAKLSPEDRAAVRAILVEAEPVTAELMNALPNLEVIAAMRSEPVNVDIAAATARSLPVIHTPGRNAESVADPRADAGNVAEHRYHSSPHHEWRHHPSRFAST
jgi:phosphoglycerate dehydrogenase-like enzyme